jgi:hypothetical protein
VQESAVETYLELVLSDILVIQAAPGALATALVSLLPEESSSSLQLLREQAMFWARPHEKSAFLAAAADEEVHPRVLKGLMSLQKAVVG